MSDASSLGDRRLAVVDYGMGNRRSVEKALEHVGVQAEVTSDPERISSADGLVLCGVGAFPAGMQALRETGLGDLVRGLAGEGTPLLGVCLGMQLLFERSEERGGDDGLGLLAGAVHALEAPTGLKLPHIGWNQVRWTDNPSPVRGDLPDDTAFYHVHSFVARPEDPSDVLATAEYGGPFVTAVSRGNVHGVQFHPEKSSADGLRVLRAFAETCQDALPNDRRAGAAADTSQDHHPNPQADNQSDSRASGGALLGHRPPRPTTDSATRSSRCPT